MEARLPGNGRLSAGFEFDHAPQLREAGRLLIAMQGRRHASQVSGRGHQRPQTLAEMFLGRGAPQINVALGAPSGEVVS